MPAVFHWVRAAQCSLSSEANVELIATVSCWPPSLCLLHALSSWPFSSHLLHCAVSFLIQSCLISMRVVASRVSARWHDTLFRFSLMSAISFSSASFITMWFFSSLLALLAYGADSLGCSSVASSDL